jgi:hypothetical protein
MGSTGSCDMEGAARSAQRAGVQLRAPATTGPYATTPTGRAGRAERIERCSARKPARGTEPSKPAAGHSLVSCNALVGQLFGQRRRLPLLATAVQCGMSVGTV